MSRHVYWAQCFLFLAIDLFRALSAVYVIALRIDGALASNEPNFKAVPGIRAGVVSVVPAIESKKMLLFPYALFSRLHSAHPPRH